MSKGVHRHGDLRECGASTIATTSKTFVNSKLVAVHGDMSNHGGSGLVCSSTLYVEGKPVAKIDDTASPCNVPHSNTKAIMGSGDTFTS